ncbi:MAG: hypothetical protein ABIA47_02735 [bacterium]
MLNSGAEGREFHSSESGALPVGDANALDLEDWAWENLLGPSEDMRVDDPERNWIPIDEVGFHMLNDHYQDMVAPSDEEIEVWDDSDEYEDHGLDRYNDMADMYEESEDDDCEAEIDDIERRLSARAERKLDERNSQWEGKCDDPPAERHWRGPQWARHKGARIRVEPNADMIEDTDPWAVFEDMEAEAKAQAEAEEWDYEAEETLLQQESRRDSCCEALNALDDDEDYVLDRALEWDDYDLDEDYDYEPDELWDYDFGVDFGRLRHNPEVIVEDTIEAIERMLDAEIVSEQLRQRELEYCSDDGSRKPVERNWRGPQWARHEGGRRPRSWWQSVDGAFV